MHDKSLFIFRRDLRVDDNTALIAALANSKQVIACFIFDPRQTDPKNPYRGEKLLRFMANSLQELNEELEKKGSKLYMFVGQAHEVVKELVSQEQIDAVYVNTDYTPFSQKRDKQIEKVSPEFYSYHDYLLHPPEAVHKADGKPYTVFTPFYKLAQTIAIPKPKKNTATNYYTKKIALEDTSVFGSFLQLPNEKVASQLFRDGGRKEALQILKHAKDYANYKEERDILALDSTTGLSAHHKFGTISIRESYYGLEGNEAVTRQLYWRDFFTQIAYFFPKVFGHAFQDKYDNVKWVDNRTYFQKWCEGKTGFPIVDAGMRELVATGYMHNRARMIVASFLTKDLHIHWKKGEEFFAQHLIDYDPAVNNGSWQWAASTGTDAQPYFRIFNPWLQQKRFDPDCKYIKKWIPELAGLEPKTIHNLDTQQPSDIEYPKPIVKHADEKDLAIAMFKSL